MPVIYSFVRLSVGIFLPGDFGRLFLVAHVDFFLVHNM